MVFALLVERVERRALAELPLVEGADAGYPDERVARFVASLEAEPERLEPEDEELLVALGLRGRGG